MADYEGWAAARREEEKGFLKKLLKSQKLDTRHASIGPFLAKCLLLIGGLVKQANLAS